MGTFGQGGAGGGGGGYVDAERDLGQLCARHDDGRWITTRSPIMLN